jgi:NAD(P)-dependent dehydrogenase (short-subunit alcohol dehydrogenase family)
VSDRLQGKTVCVTGAAGGQGRAGAILFAREGANLAICDIKEDDLLETVELIAKERPDVSVFARKVDVSVMEQIKEFITEAMVRYPAIDAMYLNAGINHVGAIEDITEDDFDRVHDINLKSNFFFVKYALPALKKSGDASIINVSSGTGLIAPSVGNSLYCSSKGGLIALTRAQAHDLAQYGIRVNCLLPGPIDTPMVRGFFASLSDEERARMQAETLSRSMYGRLGQPEEVAAVAVFLALPESRYMSAAIIPVDAGWTAT